MKSATNYEQKNHPLEFLNITTLSPKPNMHPEIEIVFCLKGKTSAYINGKCHTVNSGQFIIVFPYQIHFYDVIEEGEYLLFIFYPDITPNIKEIFCNYIPTVQVAPITQSLALRLDELNAIYNKNDTWSSTLLTGYINLLTVEILPCLQLEYISSEQSLTEKIMKYCMENFCNNITLDKLAEQLSISKSSVSHIFNNVTGLSLPYYVNWLRISAACRLLTKTSQTITSIAYEVGFSTLRNFNRVFNSIMLQTPSEYRNKFKTSKNKAKPSA